MKSLIVAALALAAAVAPAGAQSPFEGAVPQGKATPEVLSLTLSDAIARGIRANLGAVLAAQSVRSAEGGYQEARSRLLPNLSAHISEMAEQINLDAFGFPGLPGISRIIGPFGVFDSRLALTQEVLNIQSMRATEAASAGLSAAQFTAADARETVALVVTAYYLQSLAAASRVDAAKAQEQTADALYQQALDLKTNGVAPAIDVLRAQVELETERQRLIARSNEFEKAKLRLARAIGLPDGQAIRLADKLPETPSPEIAFDAALAQAYRERNDYQSLAARVKAAELAWRAAGAARLPSVNFHGDYGAQGKSPANSHGTFTAAVSLDIPVFTGGRTSAERLQADAELRRQQAQMDEMRGRIAFEIRSELLDVDSTRDQVEVSRTAVELARQQEQQARDRFAAGVANNLEVVQAQEALATANENHIASLYAYQASRAALARSMGGAEKTLPTTLAGAN